MDHGTLSHHHHLSFQGLGIRDQPTLLLVVTDQIVTGFGYLAPESDVKSLLYLSLLMSSSPPPPLSRDQILGTNKILL